MSADHGFTTPGVQGQGSNVLLRNVNVDELPRADLYSQMPETEVEPTGAWAEHLESARRSAAEEGYAAGFDEGRRAGMLAAQAVNQDMRDEVAAAAECMKEAIGGLAEADRRTADDLASDALQLGVDIASLLLDREIELGDDPGMDAIQRCFEFMPRREHVVVRLNPADVKVLGDIGALVPGSDHEIVADASIARGGALIDAGAARIDAQLDSALDRVARALGVTVRSSDTQQSGGAS